VWRNKKKAGRFTDTLPSAEGFYVPLVREDTSVGVLVVRVPPEAALTLAQRDLVESLPLNSPFSSSANRSAPPANAKNFSPSRKNSTARCSMVCHELKTPLAVLTGAAENLASADAATRAGSPPKSSPPRAGSRDSSTISSTRRASNRRAEPRLDGATPRSHRRRRRGRARFARRSSFECDVPDDLPLFRADARSWSKSSRTSSQRRAAHTRSHADFSDRRAEAGRSRVFFTRRRSRAGVFRWKCASALSEFQRGDAARAVASGSALDHPRLRRRAGGELVVGENPGGGAVFCLPSYERTVKVRANERARAPARLLVIDDDCRSAGCCAHARSAGTVCARPRPATRAQRSAVQRPDAIVLDLSLPDTERLDVLRRIREWSLIPC